MLNAENEMAWAYVNGLEIDHPIERIGFLNGVSRQRQVYHTDALGSVVAMSDESGTVIQRYSYNAFGSIHSQTGNTLNRITYTAREALGDSLGLYYYRNRVIDPTIGRFISEDPLGFIDGPNRYIYVKNNPIYFIDAIGAASINPGGMACAFGLMGAGELVNIGITIIKYAPGWTKLVGLPFVIGGAVLGTGSCAALEKG